MPGENRAWIPAADLPDEARERCDQIAYQFSGVIQPHGLLVVVDENSGQIVQTSENVFDVWDVTPEALLGQPLNAARLTWHGQSLELSQLGTQAECQLLHDVLDRFGRSWTLRCHRQNQRVMVEFEATQHSADLHLDHPEQMVSALGHLLADTKSLDEILARFPDKFREFVSYDRCIIYRFDPEYNGEVIGESRSERSEDSFLGLRFPSSDIPKSARQMFAMSPVRVTVDQTRSCVAIRPRRDPITHADVNLSLVRLRGAAGSCQTYYNNMGVRSTMIMPIFVAGRLWGMLSCHHGEPKRPAPDLDKYFQIVVQLVSSAIEKAELLESAAAEQRAKQINFELASVEPTDPDWPRHLERQQASLAGLLECTGFLLRIDNNTYTQGKVPTGQDQETLVDWLYDEADGDVYATNSIPLDQVRFRHLNDVASGALVVPLLRSRRDVAIWFRAERAQTIHWAGDPQSGLRWNQEGRPVLTPRDSFEVWKSTTAGTCRPWTSQERAYASAASMHIGLMVLSWHATQASRSKSEFLANMSHEIRTPMTAIKGFAELLFRDEELLNNPEELRRAVSTIHSNADHLLAIVNDVLDISKIESGKVTVEAIPTCSIDVVAEVLQLMQVAAETKKIYLRAELESNVPIKMATDPAKLRQILLNLVSNSIKFTERGGITLLLGVETRDDLLYLRFKVRDTGIGMTVEQLNRVRRFEAFTQADSSVTRQFGGTGLGLRISQSFARLMGGWINVDSRMGQGSEFCVYLPVVATEELRWFSPDQALQRLRSSPTRTESSLSSTPNLEGARVLIAEDGVDNQRLLQLILRKAEATIQLAENGQLAIEKVNAAARQNVPFDIILMDMQMPEKDGYTATTELRKSGFRMPIIALTAHAMQGDKEKCLRAGCDDYLTKPIDRQRLLETCLWWVRKSRSLTDV